MNSFEEMKAACDVFQKNLDGHPAMFYATHDKIMITGVKKPQEMDPGDDEKLIGLGWHYDENENECWTMFC